jgi:hypothetical protein
MGDRVLGKAYLPCEGMCWVEPSTHNDIFVLRSMQTGETFSRARANIQWRR